MNLSIPKRFLIISAVLYVCSFLFFFIINYVQFAPKNIDLYFKGSWILNSAMIRFFDNMVTIQCCAIIFTFSVFYPRIKTESGIEVLTAKNFNSLVTVVIIILLLLTAVFFTEKELLQPRLYQKLDTLSYLTKTGRAYYEQAEQYSADGKLFEAETAIKRYLAIKPDDEAALDLFKTISGRIENQYSLAERDAPVSSESEPVRDLTYKDAMKLAENFLKTEDYYSAYYYAQIASRLSGGAGDARGLSSEAWALLSETEPSSEETEAFSLHNRKKQGTKLLLAGKPIEAYYLFNQLAVEYPEDPDIIKYTKESVRETRKLTYFIDEAENALSLPGITDICFLNVNNETERELFYCEKVVFLSEGIFFRNIETMAIGSDKGVLRHMTAEYGKLYGDHIVLNGIDRENNKIRIIPEYLVSDSLPELYNTIKLNIDYNLLGGLSSSSNIYRKMNIIELYEFEPLIAAFGWMVEPLYLEIITRILNPFAFIILSLIMIAISWKYRRFAGKLPVAALILSPALVYIIALLTEAYIYGIRILCGWLFLGFGKPAALALLTSSQVILLITAFLLIAGLKTSDGRQTN